MFAAALFLLQACATEPETIELQPSDGKTDGATTVVLTLAAGQPVNVSWMYESHFSLPELNGCDTAIKIDAMNDLPIGTKIGTIVHREIGVEGTQTYDLIRGVSEYAIGSDSVSSHWMELKNTSNQSVTILFDAQWQ